MKARVITKSNNTQIPKRILEDKECAEKFWEELKTNLPNGNYGESFDEWYEKVKLVDFYNKASVIWQRHSR
jgi:hypothetical protein